MGRLKKIMGICALMIVMVVAFGIYGMKRDDTDKVRVLNNEVVILEDCNRCGLFTFPFSEYFYGYQKRRLGGIWSPNSEVHDATTIHWSPGYSFQTQRVMDAQGSVLRILAYDPGDLNKRPNSEDFILGPDLLETMYLCDYSGRMKQSFEVPPLHGSEVAFSGDGKYFAVSGRKEKHLLLYMTSRSWIEVWEADSGRKIFQTPVGRNSFIPIDLVVLSHDKLFIVDGWIQCWDIQHGQLLYNIRLSSGGVFIPILSRDEKMLFVHHKNQYSMVFDTSDGRLLFSYFYREKEGSKDWAMVTPDGCYDGTESMLKTLKIRDANQYISPTDHPEKRIPALANRFFKK